MTHKTHIKMSPTRICTFCKCFLMLKIPFRTYVRSKHRPQLFFAKLPASTARCPGSGVLTPVHITPSTWPQAAITLPRPAPTPNPLLLSLLLLLLSAQQLGDMEKVNQRMSLPCPESFSAFFPIILIKISTPDSHLASRWAVGLP